MENIYFLINDNISEINILSSIKQAHYISISNKSFRNFIYLINNHRKELIHYQKLNDFVNLIYVQILSYHRTMNIDKLTNLQHLNLELPYFRTSSNESTWNKSYVTVHSRLQNHRMKCVSTLKKLTRIDLASHIDHIKKLTIYNPLLRIVTTEGKLKSSSFMLSLPDLERMTITKSLTSSIRNKLHEMFNLTYLCNLSSSNSMNKYFLLKSLRCLDCSDVNISTRLNDLNHLQKLSLRNSYGNFMLTNITNLKLYYCCLIFDIDTKYSNLQRLKFKRNGIHPDTFTCFNNLTKLIIDRSYQDEGMEHYDVYLSRLMSKTKQVTTLRDLRFCTNDTTVSESTDIDLNVLSDLEKLNLSMFLEENINISKLNQLTYLKLQRCPRQITYPSKLTSLIVLKKNQSVKDFDYSTWTNIERLSVMKSKERSYLSKLTHLRSLSVTFIDMKDIDLNRFIYLTSLKISNCENTPDQGYENFQKFAILTNLLKLFVEDNINTRYLDKLSNLTHLKCNCVVNYKNEIEKLTRLRILQIFNTPYVKINKSRMKQLHTFEETQLSD